MKKRIISVLLCVVMVSAMLVGCSSSKKESATNQTETTTGTTSSTATEEKTDSTETTASTDSSKGGLTFAYCTSTLNNPFMTTIGDALKAVCEADGNKLITYDPQYDQATQISQVEDAITQGVDGIFLLPVDSDGVKTVLESAKAKGIPVIAIDNPVTDVDLVAANVASDNFNAGYIIGEAMMEDFPNGAKIAVIDSPTMVACVDRFEGFIKALEDKGMKDKFDICAQQDAQASLEKAMPIAENMLQANPDIQAFYGINDPTALGIIAALKAAGKSVGEGGILVYGVDGSPDGKQSIVDGTLQVTAAQSPVGLAETSYENMKTVLAGGTIEKDIKVDTFRIDADNVATYGTDGWQ